MHKEHLRQSPLAHRHLSARATSAGGDAAVTLCERPFRGQIVLRGDPGNQAFAGVVQKVTGAGVPVRPNTVAQKNDTAILWLGPDEWLIVVPDGHEAQTMTALKDVLEGMHYALTDVSDSRAIIGLSGPCAPEVLMKGCGLDLHARAFGPSQCAQTPLARCHMLLHQIEATPTYDIYVHRSFADYAWRWLEDAATEYGVAIVSLSQASQ